MLFGHQIETRHEYKTFQNADGEEQSFGAGFFDKSGNGVNFEKVFEQNYVLVIVLRGEGILLDKQTGVEYSLKAGSYFQRLPNRVHSLILESDSRWCEFFVIIPATLFGILKSMNGVDSEALVGDLELTSNLVDRFVAYVDFVASVSNSMVYSLLPEVCALITDCINGVKRQSVVSEFLINAKHYLEESYNKKSDIEDYCRKNGCSYVSFRTKFKRQFGMSPYQYRIHCRMDKAVEFLCNLDHSIKDIADMLGYSTQYEFSNHFKKYFSVSPNKFRKNRLSVKNH